MKKFLILLLVVATSCATTKGCGYAKAKAYNDKQMKKAKRHRVSYADNISNPDNAEFIEEIAFNEDIEPASVTQAMFNLRYGVE
jgi:hypothetical protein